MKYIMILSVLLMVGCAKRAAEAKLEQTLLNAQHEDTSMAQAVRLTSGEYGVQLCNRSGCTLTGYHFLDKEDAISTRDSFNAQKPTVLEVVE